MHRVPHTGFPKRSGMGRIGRLIITEVRLLSLTLSFLAQVCVSPVTLSLPLGDAKLRLARLSHYTRPVPPPPTPTSQGHLWLRVFWGPGGGMWSSWHVPEATYCALASRSCPGLSGTSRVGNAGLAAVEDSPRLQDPPDPGSPPPSSANLDPRSPREEALGASSIAAASAPGAPDSSPSRPFWDSAFLAVRREQTSRRPPSDPARHPSDPRGAGTCAQAHHPHAVTSAGGSQGRCQLPGDSGPARQSQPGGSPTHTKRMKSGLGNNPGVRGRLALGWHSWKVLFRLA